MKIFVDSQSGSVITVDIDPSDSICNLKVKIKDVIDISTEKQQLYFDHRALEDSRTLEECNIEEQSTVLLDQPINENTVECCINALSLTEKGNLKWFGSIENLQAVVCDLTKVSSKFASAGGTCKLFETETLAVRWYTNTNTLTVRGEESGKLITQLRGLADKVVEKQLIQDPPLSNCCFDENVNSVDVNDVSSHTEIYNLSSGDTVGNVLQKIQQVEERIDIKIENLAREIGQANKNIEKRDQFNINDNFASREYLEFLHKENKKLQEENKALVERSNNLSYVLSDLNCKVKDLESEKKSLLTVIKFLQPEQVFPAQHDPWKVVPENKPRPKRHTIKIPSDEETMETFNRFSILSDSESENSDPELIQQKLRHVKNKQKSSGHSLMSQKNKQTTDKGQRKTREGQSASNITGLSSHRSQGAIQNNTKDKQSNKQIPKHPTSGPRSERQPTDGPRADSQGNSYGNKSIAHKRPKPIVVLGDSMIRRLQPNKIRESTKKHVIIKTFAGATTDEMSDYAKPSIRNELSHIIIHVGTNDLKNSHPSTIAQNVYNLCDEVTANSPNISISISEIIQRKDNQEMNLKALEVNRLFADICRSRDWSLISHTNIAEGSLDRSGLHLNPQGTALLASNFINHTKHF